MNKSIVYIFFYLPLIISSLNIQSLISQFVSSSLAQIVAYLNLILIMTGALLFRNKIGILSTTNRLWFIFFILYYSFGLLASGVSGFETSVIATLIPVIYFICFNFFLSDPKEFKVFFSVITICFVVSAFLTIVLIKMNINMKSGTVYEWDLDRAGGITGDANAAALVSILGFIMLNQLYQPSKLIYRVIKVLILTMLFYSLFLTFSTTGLFVFTIVFVIINYKFFTGLKLILFVAIIPLFYLGVFALQSQTKNLNLSNAQINKIENITNLLTFNFEKVDNSGRSDLLEHVMIYLYENPILGNGVNFAVEMRGHNTYVGIWVDAGVLTFLFFLFMLSFYLLKAFTLDPKTRFFSIALLFTLCIFMISLQSVLNQPHLMVLFVYIGYLIDYNKLEKSIKVN